MIISFLQEGQRRAYISYIFGANILLHPKSGIILRLLLIDRFVEFVNSFSGEKGACGVAIFAGRAADRVFIGALVMGGEELLLLEDIDAGFLLVVSLIIGGVCWDWSLSTDLMS